MEPQRRTILGIAVAGVALIATGTFSKSWFTGTNSGTSIKIGLSGGESCAGGQCQAIDLAQVDNNWNIVGMIGLIAGLAAIGAAGYAMFLVIKRREAKLDPKKLALPAAAAAAAAIAFILIKPVGGIGKVSWAGFVAIAGHAAVAGAMFLAQRLLGGFVQQSAGWQQPPQYHTQPSYPPQGYPPQQPGYTPPPQGYAPPGGGYPPQQGYAPPQQPVQVQRIQPILPTMPPHQQHHPQAMTPMQPHQPGSSPPVPMMQKQSTTIPPGSNPCPRCGTGLAFSPNHNKWYCARCQQYTA